MYEHDWTVGALFPDSAESSTPDFGPSGGRSFLGGQMYLGRIYQFSFVYKVLCHEQDTNLHATCGGVERV